MNDRQQIVLYARHTAGMVRVAIQSQRPQHLMDCVTQRLVRLWDYGCHADNALAADKEAARRCVTAINAMFRKDELT